jgi:hypothetical protein
VAAIYPAREAFYISGLVDSRPIFQGDIFRAVPSVRATHPAVVESDFAALATPLPGDFAVPSFAQARDALVLECGYSLLLPNPCEFSEEEKGANHRERILAHVRPIREASNQKTVRQGGGAISTFWLPSWEEPLAVERDPFVSFGRISTVDAAYLSRSRRVAALSRPAWIVLIQRLCAYFGGIALSAEAIATQVAHLYPE